MAFCFSGGRRPCHADRSSSRSSMFAAFVLYFFAELRFSWISWFKTTFASGSRPRSKARKTLTFSSAKPLLPTTACSCSLASLNIAFWTSDPSPSGAVHSWIKAQSGTCDSDKPLPSMKAIIWFSICTRTSSSARRLNAIHTGGGSGAPGRQLRSRAATPFKFWYCMACTRRRSLLRSATVDAFFVSTLLSLLEAADEAEVAGMSTRKRLQRCSGQCAERATKSKAVRGSRSCGHQYRLCS
mmetsp:Transcript_32207/g.73654  ORF Transcript_32207/g.73654 Transcript_32207/m.73654 type:complete len:241 (-) Transcript_32207:2432-3154(-)